MSRDIRIGAPLLWIVVPCRDEEAMLPLSMPRLERLRADMVARGLIEGGSRIVYVDDCSTDGTWDIICRQNEENPLHCGLHLGRNAGQQYALLAGTILAVNTASLWLLVTKLGVNRYVAKILVEAVLFVINYFVQKRIV